jgi:hypothetical protein
LSVRAEPSALPQEGDTGFPDTTPSPSDSGTPTDATGADSGPAIQGPQSTGFVDSLSPGVSEALEAGSLSFLLSVGEQVTGSVTLGGDDAAFGETGSFDFTGSKWVAVVGAAKGQDTVSLQLPDNVMGEGMRLSLKNGMPLPNWVRFDPASGRLSVDSQRMADVQKLDIRVESRMADGTVQEMTLEIRSQPADLAAEQGLPDVSSSAEQPSATNEQALTLPRAEQTSAPPQMEAGHPSDLLDEVRALLADLAGLPAGTAFPANETRSRV